MTRRGFFDPHVERYLIADEGEVVIDEVAKHWAAIVTPVLELLLALPVLLLIFVMPSQLYWLPVVAALWLALRGIWRILQAQMDRFVITNMRVFRVHGILSQHIATMPITRILDISVKRPFVGRIFGYGHFIFESAAQDQGLREIKFVGKPNERGLTIQRVIQRSGLRGGMRSATRDYVNADSGRGDGSPFSIGSAGTVRTDTAPINTLHAETPPVDTSAWSVSTDNPAWDPKSGDTQPLG
ncbi:PH domain-containing protein [Agromyces sp. SYSU K20354]|uniref:PH domain-containing protein n=1 Tax=Agromyces cavernae TaxID=2898659 RepID=UPI001E29A5F6|nr:PH domain-containing protein [Agromyces cavernae]MCD2443464.1 PH domain-containing protein [Agromyces cavernae]